MKKIMILGISPGVGKSTFAKQLGAKLDLQVYHLDSYYWQSGWRETPFEEFEAAQKKIVKLPRWVIEGNYQSTFPIRAEYADTVIYLQLPLYMCLFRVFARWLRFRGINRPELPEGCHEKIDWEFISYITRIHRERSRSIQDEINQLNQIGQKKQVYILKSKKEVLNFLQA